MDYLSLAYLLVIALYILLVTLWIIWRKRKLSLFKRLGIPGPKPKFWTGNLSQITNLKNAEQYLIDKYGKFVGIYLGSKPFLLAADPELLKIIQDKEFNNFMNKEAIFSDFGVPHKCMTKSMKTAKGENWRMLKHSLNSAFIPGQIKNMIPNMNEAVDGFLKKMNESKQPVDAMDHSKQLAFDIMCRTSFEMTSNVKKNLFTDSLEYVLRFGANSMLDVITICLPEFEPVLKRLRWMIDWLRGYLNLPSAGIVVNTCQNIIDMKKKFPQKTAENLLQLLINVNTTEKNKTEELTDDAVIANTLMFMMEGQEAISSTLGFTMYLLAKNPDIQDKLRGEINRILGRKDRIEYSKIGEMHYLNQVLAEVLRLYPLFFPSVNRICTRPFRYRHIIVPKNLAIVVPVWYMHRNPEYWPSPEEFNPDRFSSENRTKIDQFVYQPYGVGPRSCAGMRLSQVILKYILVHLIKSYKLEKANKFEELRLNFRPFFVRPANKVLLRINPLK